MFSECPKCMLYGFATDLANGMHVVFFYVPNARKRYTGIISSLLNRIPVISLFCKVAQLKTFKFLKVMQQQLRWQITQYESGKKVGLHSLRLHGFNKVTHYVYNAVSNVYTLQSVGYSTEVSQENRLVYKYSAERNAPNRSLRCC